VFFEDLLSTGGGFIEDIFYLIAASSSAFLAQSGWRLTAQGSLA
jgi:hypothetical protein